MSMWKPTPSRRSLQPSAECLETRELLAAVGRGNVPKGTPTQPATQVVRGMDPDGAMWTMRLYGPGALQVVGTDGAVFTRAFPTTPDSIDTITVAGANTLSTRLVTTVYPNPVTKNAKVYFENLNVTPSGELGKIDEGQVSNFRSVANGILAIDMPDFYLAHTETTAPNIISTNPFFHNTMTTPPPDSTTLDYFIAGSINIPQGVITLRLGGVDVDYVPPGGVALNQTQQNNEFQIDLGLPIVQGTSIILNTVNSDGEVSSTSGNPALQDFATFLVTGRLNLFQANEIDGNTTSGLVPTQFSTTSVAQGSESAGGTFVISQGGPATGQIGNIRVGGSATNFTAYATEDARNAAALEGQLDAKISNFYIGGQTDNILLVAPSGARNVAFGLGMDNVTINANAIDSLRANRDALNSNVTVSRSIQNLLIGGDVENTNVNVGETQDLFTFLGYTLPNSTIGHGAFYGDPMPTIANPQFSIYSNQIQPTAQNGGTIQARIAGSVINSIFSAAVDPDPTHTSGTLYGSKQGLILPRGVINAKVEGNISNANNTLVDPASTGRAFFAKSVKLIHGPVIPPTVPYQPFAAPTTYHRGQNGLKGLFKIDHVPAVTGPARKAEHHDTKKKK